MKLRSPVLLGALLSVAPVLCLAQQSPAPTTEGSSRVDAQAQQDLLSKRKAALAVIANDRARADVARQIVDENSQVIEKLKQSIRARTGLLSSAGLQPLVSSLQLQKETLEEEDAAAAGRRAGLETTIAEWTDRAKASAKSDPLLDELNIVVEKQSTDVQRKQQLLKSAAISQGEVDDSIAALAAAKAKVITARQRAASAANEATDVWNRELMNLNIAAQERAARLKYIASRLSTLEPAMDDVERLESATAELHAAQQNLRLVKQRADEDERFSR